jgi:hypothetical protein
MKLKYITIFFLLLMATIGGIGYYFFNKWIETENRKIQMLNRERTIKTDKAIQESNEKIKQLKEGSPLNGGRKMPEARIERFNWTISNIDCSQIYRTYSDENHPIAYMNGVPLNGMLQPGSEIQNVMAQACRN